MEVRGADLGNPGREPTAFQLAGQEDLETCCLVQPVLLQIFIHTSLFLSTQRMELPC